MLITPLFLSLSVPRLTSLWVGVGSNPNPRTRHVSRAPGRVSRSRCHRNRETCQGAATVASWRWVTATRVWQHRCDVTVPDVTSQSSDATRFIWRLSQRSRGPHTNCHRTEEWGAESETHERSPTQTPEPRPCGEFFCAKVLQYARELQSCPPSCSSARHLALCNRKTRTYCLYLKTRFVLITVNIYFVCLIF